MPSGTTWQWRTLRTSSSTRRRAWMIPRGTARQSLKAVGTPVSAFSLVWDGPTPSHLLYEKRVDYLLGWNGLCQSQESRTLRLKDPFGKVAIDFFLFSTFAPNSAFLQNLHWPCPPFSDSLWSVTRYVALGLPWLSGGCTRWWKGPI